MENIKGDLMERYKKNLILAIAIIVFAFAVWWFIYPQISMRANLPLKVKECPYTYSDYSVEFTNQTDDFGVYRWGYDKPDYRMSGEAYLYGYDKDPDNIYAFDAIQWKLYYKGGKSPKDSSANIADSIVLAHYNCGEVRHKWVFDIVDGETKTWLTDKTALSSFMDFIQNIDKSALVSVANVEGFAFVRAIYSDAPVYEIVGRLYKCKDNQYYFLPYNCGAFNANIGTPVDISQFGELPVDCFWNSRR